MAQSEYTELRDSDWNSLRRALRRFNERLSELEGFSGTTTRRASLKLDGNNLLNGPKNQVKAAADEFITRDYLGSDQAANLVGTGDADVPNAPDTVVTASRDPSGMVRLTLTAARPTENHKSCKQTQFQLSKSPDSAMADPFYNQLGPVPFTDTYMTTAITEFFYRARTLNSVGWSAWSEIGRVSTEGDLIGSDSDVPTAPVNVTLKADDVDPSISGKELILEWDPPTTNAATITSFLLEVDTNPDFPDDVVLSTSNTGEATRGSYIFTSPGGGFLNSWVGRTLRIYVDVIDGKTFRYKGKIVRVDSESQVTLDTQVRIGGTNLKYDIIVPSSEQVLLAQQVPVQSIGLVSLIPLSSHYRRVMKSLALDTYYGRVRAENSIGVGAWCDVVGPAVVDGIKVDDVQPEIRYDWNFGVVAGTFTSNSPNPGFIAWAGVKVRFRNTEYSITDGNTDKKWVFWFEADPTNLTGQDAFDTTGLGYCIALNADGIALQQWESGKIVDGSKIADGSIAKTQFASGIKPYDVLDALPETGGEGDVVFLTTDSKLYRWDVDLADWTTAVEAPDLTGQLTDDQIAEIAAAKIAGQLTDAQLAEISAAKLVGQIVDAQLAGISAVKIDGQLTDAQIAEIAAAKVSGQLTNAQLADIAAAKVTGQITGTQITDGAISTAKLQAGAVTANEITAGTITSDQIAANTITGSNIAGATISGDKIVGSTITGDKIAGTTITAANIAGTTITGDKIAGNTITGSKIAATTITGANIFGWTITGDKIAVNQIGAGHIIAGQISSSHIGAEQIVAGHIAAGQIVTEHMSAESINADRLTVGTLNGDRLIANTVNGNKILANTLDAGKIVAGSITATQIHSAGITGDRIAGTTITGSNIAGSTITADKISVVNLSAIKSDIGTITAGTITGAAIRTAATGNARVEMSGTTIAAYAANNSVIWSISNAGNWNFNEGAITSNRGDPANPDFSRLAGTLTCDGNFHTLDLSSIVPAGMRFVLLRFSGVSGASVNSYFMVANNTDSNYGNASYVYAIANNGYVGKDMLVACDANRYVKYASVTGAFSVASLTVGAYWP